MKRLWRKYFLYLAAAVMLSSVVVLGISYYIFLRFACAQKSFFYGQPRAIAKKMSDKLIAQAPVERVILKTADGLSLAAFWIPRENALGTVVCCHGYRGSKEGSASIVDIFSDMNLLVFDFRAHGESDGKYVTFGDHEHLDVIAACTYAKQRTTTEPLVVIGFSMGGAAALHAAFCAPDLCDALIIDSSFANFNDVMDIAFPQEVGLPAFPFAMVVKMFIDMHNGSAVGAVSPEQWVKSIAKPIFFIHACTDTVTPPGASLRLYAASSNVRSKLWIGPPTIHAALHHEHQKRYRNKVKKFITHSCSVPPPQL